MKGINTPYIVPFFTLEDQEVNHYMKTQEGCLVYGEMVSDSDNIANVKICEDNLEEAEMNNLAGTHQTISHKTRK